MNEPGELERDLERLRQESAEREAIREEMEKRRRPEHDQRKRLLEDIPKRRPKTEKLLKELQDAEDRLRRRRRRAGFALAVTAAVVGVVLVWVATVIPGFWSKLAETLGGAMLVAATVGAGAGAVGRLVRQEEQRRQQQQGRQVDQILTAVDDLTFRLEWAELEVVAGKLYDLEERRARLQIRLNAMEERSEVSEPQRRIRESLSRVLRAMGREIEQEKGRVGE